MGGGGSKEEAQQIKLTLEKVNEKANAYRIANTESFTIYDEKQSNLFWLQTFLTVYAIAIIIFLLLMAKK
jgi:hypothetical protein